MVRLLLTRTLSIGESNAKDKFRSKATALGYDPDGDWVGGYVDYEWGKVKHILDVYLGENKHTILEFGCNIGATAIVAARLGHKVQAVDTDETNVELGILNAEQYGVGNNIEFSQITQNGHLSYEDGFFEVIICNSVLEYVDGDDLERTIAELDRLLKPGGTVIITGTSNRLSAKEVHSGRWFINYLPRALNQFQIGVNPFRVIKAFKGYKNLDLIDGGEKYVETRRRFGQSKNRIYFLKFLTGVLRLFNISVGLLTPSFSVVLQKPD